MKAISMDMVKLSGAIEVREILDFTVMARVNEHGYMDFKGIISTKHGLKDVLVNLEGEEMCLRCGDVPYFSGKLIKARIKNVGEYYTIEAECISCSSCFDLEKHSRSFQDTMMTYEQMLKRVEKASGIGNILPIAGKSDPIGYPIIQYEETDWEFTKRMASHYGTIVIPEIAYGQPQISMGVIEGQSYILDEHVEYEIMKNISAFYNKEKEHEFDLKKFIYYKVRDYHNFELGDKVKFKGYPLIVVAKKLYIKDGLLEAEYELGYEQGYGIKRSYNEPISGKSIKGKVLATIGERLQVHLDIDETQDKEKAYWYTWMPQTGNLMYCMPKVGTKVHLYFPDHDEANAIITECVRTNGGQLRGGMNDYTFRQFRTEHDKGVMLAPGYINFRGDAEQSCNTLNLIDGRGITVQTEQHIAINCMKKLSILAEGKIEISAGTLLKAGMTGEKSGIEMSGSEINKYAEKIYHNGLAQDAEKPRVLEPSKPLFPAGIFAGTVTAMVPVSTAGENSDPAMLSVLGMINIGICKLA